MERFSQPGPPAADRGETVWSTLNRSIAAWPDCSPFWPISAGIRGEGEERFLADSRSRAAAERWLHIAAECAIDLANQIIADRGWPTPETYRHAFRILLERGAISPKTAMAMEGWAALRNVLVHLYASVDPLRLWKTIDHDLDQLERYAAELTRPLP